MARLTLRLTGDGDILLRSSAFYDSALTSEVRFVLDEQRSCASLQHSPAVQAFLLLAIQAAAFGRRALSRARPAGAGLRGGPESPAATLAAAIDAKTSATLLGIFGTERNGRPIVHRVFNVERYEERTMRYVTVSFNSGCLLPNEIQIVWNGVSMDDPEALEGLAQVLEASWRENGPNASKRRERESLEPFLRSIYQRELDETIASKGSPVFDLTSLRPIMRHPGLQRIGGPQPLEYVDRIPNASVFPRGRQLTAVEGYPRLRVAVPPSLAGALAIFRLLEMRTHRAVTMDYDYSYSRQIVQAFCDEPAHLRPDLCVLAVPTALRERRLQLAKHGAFQPIMLLPQTTHQIIAPNHTSRLTSKVRRYHLMTEFPGTGYVYFRELVKSQMIDESRTLLEHTEPTRLFAALAERDPESRAIIWFPHYDLNCYLNDCRVVDGPKNSLAHQGIVLLASARLRRNTVQLESIIAEVKRAWMTLRASKLIRERIVDSLISDTRYLEVLLRSGGMNEARAHPQGSGPSPTSSLTASFG